MQSYVELYVSDDRGADIPTADDMDVPDQLFAKCYGAVWKEDFYADEGGCMESCYD